MGTSVDRGTPEGQERRWKQARRTSSIIIGLVVLCLITAVAIGCNAQLSKGGRLPEIVSFQANPPINEGDPVNYTFEVKNASKIVLIEAGETIKEIAGPSSGIYKGAATGQAPSAVLTSDNYTLGAVLEASNEQGTVKKTATLSGSALLKTNLQYGDRPCPTGCGCSAPLVGGVQTLCPGGCLGPVECQSILLAESGYKKYCYQIPVQPCDTAAGCTCMEPSQAPSDYTRCNDNLCAANPDKYCYRQIPVQPCDTAAGCICIEPGQAPSYWTKCSDNLCAANPDKYCYSPHPCDTAAGCTCMEPSQAPSDYIWCSNNGPCAEYPPMYCYHPIPACDTANGCTCMEPSQAPSGYIRCGSDRCAINPDKYCYRPPEACTCQWDYITFIAICLGGT